MPAQTCSDRRRFVRKDDGQAARCRLAFLRTTPNGDRHLGSSVEPEAGTHVDQRCGRITQLPVMRQRHYIGQHMLSVNPKATVKKLTNCNDCHENAAQGSFAYREILVPGITKVVRPGGMF